MHVAAVSVFEPRDDGSLTYDDVARLIRHRLHLAPRLRQRVLPVSGNIARPVWVDDETFNLQYHVRHTHLPVPGDEHPYLRWWREHTGSLDLPDEAVIRARTAYYGLVTSFDRMVGSILDRALTRLIDDLEWRRRELGWTLQYPTVRDGLTALSGVSGESRCPAAGEPYRNPTRHAHSHANVTHADQAS